MFYCILCYNLESEIQAWSREKEAAVMAKREVVTHRLAAAGRLGPVGRLMPTTTAVTLRAGRDHSPRATPAAELAAPGGASPALVLDGPFAETKEQLLGFYVVDCASLEEALEVARGLVGETGALEVRPFIRFFPGIGLQ